MSDFATFSSTVIAFVARYVVHSTLLLALCWLSISLARPKSHFLAERMWKLATVLGILTAFSQLLVGANTSPIVMQSPTDSVGASAELIFQSNRLSYVPEETLMVGATVETIPDPLELGVEIEDGDVEFVNRTIRHRRAQRIRLRSTLE